MIFIVVSHYMQLWYWITHRRQWNVVGFRVPVECQKWAGSGRRCCVAYQRLAGLLRTCRPTAIFPRTICCLWSIVKNDRWSSIIHVKLSQSQDSSDHGRLEEVTSVMSTYRIRQCFSTAGPRPGTGPWHQLYRAARGSPGICRFSFLSIFHE